MPTALTRPLSSYELDRSWNRETGPAGNSPDVHEAASSGDLDALTWHVSHGRATAPSAAGFAPIHHAASHGRDAAIALLLRSGASVNQRSGHGCDGTTALHCAIAGGHVDTVALLLARGASTQATDEAGYTPLLLAAELGLLAAVKLLLTHGADPHVEIGDHGPLAAARRNRHAQVVALLRQVGVR
ncbi:MAG: ankyrin repeat domain-containing protein [Alphaproteobacteria bacterium]|nr:ankyrin repeat domain-containing protein [Alphaproteobacteria bacterium]